MGQAARAKMAYVFEETVVGPLVVERPFGQFFGFCVTILFFVFEHFTNKSFFPKYYKSFKKISALFWQIFEKIPKKGVPIKNVC